MYEIIDNNGVIYSSSNLEELQHIFTCMTEPDSIDEDERVDVESDWEGDLKLIKILQTAK